MYLALPILLFTSACDKIGGGTSDGAGGDSDLAQAAVPADPLAAVRAEIVQRNFGRAAELARAAVAAAPTDPNAAFELARAEALSGNQGYALDALEQAVNKGLANASTALKDEAFAALRPNSRYKELLRKANPSSKSASGGSTEAPRSQGSLSAGGRGGVSIQESGGSTTIRAGDVTLHTDF